MISEIQIENFKSISKLSLGIGNLTVLIGENGSGKSNILEAITFAAAASVDKLDNEFLYNRGIRVTEKDWVTPAFDLSDLKELGDFFVSKKINIKIEGDFPEKFLKINIWRQIYKFDKNIDTWEVSRGLGVNPDLPIKDEEYMSDLNFFESFLKNIGLAKDGKIDNADLIGFARAVAAHAKVDKHAQNIGVACYLRDFLIFAPENTSLRKFDEEGAIKPLGPRGEGLLKLLQDMSGENSKEFISELNEALSLLGWFSDLKLPTEADEIKGRLLIRDRWLSEEAPLFDQRSANEGFLYLLFYFTLILSSRTPQIFAIDNIDTALNPKLCAELIRQIAILAKKKGKQVICTTHNPAILDGLNLTDESQRLYVVRRDSEGRTVATRVKAPRTRPDGVTTPLSTAFMSGYLGGLPEHF